MLPTLDCSSSSRSPISSSSRCFDASSFCTSSRSIETHHPTISQIIDSSNPSSSSQKIAFRAAASFSSTTAEPKLEYLPGVSKSLKYLSPSCKSVPRPSLVVDIPRPLESLQSSPIPPFLSKTYEIVNDPSLDRLVCWSTDGQSFVVWDPVEFSRVVLPLHFKHGNFSSFVRQLNTYGFRKLDGDGWEFANEDFLRGKRLLLKNINRRKSSSAQSKGPYLGSSVETKLLGAEDELQKLRSEKYVLMEELMKMKEEHLVTVKQMDKLNCRLQSAELRQKQMIMSFCTKVLRNPIFLMRLKQKNNLRKIVSTRSIQRSIEQDQPSYVKSTTQQIVKYRQSFCEPGSTFVSQGLESCTKTQLTDHRLQDMSVKLDPDVDVQVGSSNKPLEIVEPLFSLKRKNKLISKENGCLGSAVFNISSPEGFSSNIMAMEPISLSECFTEKDLQIDTFNGKNAAEISSPVNDVFQDPVFFSSVRPGVEIACKEEFWDVEFEAGGRFNSAHDMRDNLVCTNPVVPVDEIGHSEKWDNLVCTNPVLPGDEIGLSEMWDIGLRSVEDLDFDKFFSSQFPPLLHMDENGLRDDHPKT